MALKNKIFLSGEWTFLSISKTDDPDKVHFRLTLTDEEGDHVCCFSDSRDLEVDGLSRVTHLSLEIKRSTGFQEGEELFEVIDIQGNSLDFKCASVTINGDEF